MQSDATGSTLIASCLAEAMAWRQPVFSALLAMSLLPAAASAAAALKLQIVQRPPYLMVAANGDVSGIAVQPTVAAFKKAGIAVEWQAVPALRQLQRLKDNREKVCSVGWYKTREREQFAKFTHAVSQDSPWAGLANIAFKPPPNLTVKAMLADSQITVLLKNGYVYGDYLDIQIAGMKAQHMETTGDMLQVFKMIARGRAQITFAPVDEIRYYLDAGAISRADTKVIEFPEMPAGYKRYLMCSKQVDDQTIAQFNAALSTP